MLTISRNILRRFRTLCRRGGLHKSHLAGGPVVTFVGGVDGCRIRVASADVAIEFHDPVPVAEQTMRLPMSALALCEGRDESVVTFTMRPDEVVELAWFDHGVPRSSEQIQPQPKEESFPAWPETTVSNDAELWSGLADAVESTDAEATRYALGCVHLRGALGNVEATDGHQALVQSGFRFGFDEDLLIPATKLLGCADLVSLMGFRVGRTEKHVGIESGSWRLTLRIQDGRFPKLDQILPSGVAVKSTLELSNDDARFLREAIPRLPSHDDLHKPITFDLNGKVLIRCREVEKARPTELQLDASKLVGEPIVFNTNRMYVERALRLGFRCFGLFSPASPVLCDDGRRRLVWMLLDKSSAIPRHADPIRISSPTSPARDARPCSSVDRHIAKRRRRREPV